MHVETFIRQWSAAVFDDEKASHDNYAASCQVFQYGDRGFMYSITGKKFYEGAMDILAQAKDKGCVSLEGYVSRVHVRLLKRVLGPSRVEVGKPGEMGGHPLVWVTIKV